MAEPRTRPAFYAAATRGRAGDWWTLLHPPYTVWHLSYVAIGAAVAPRVDGVRLTATLLAFFLAVGVGAHTLDEVHGHPLQTRVPDTALWAAGLLAVLGALVIGALGVSRVGLGLIGFMVVGPLLLVPYNLEWWGGRLHNDMVFALAWGAFPVLTSYFAQAERIDIVAVVAAVSATFLSWAQRSLSSPARTLRRRVAHVDGQVTYRDGQRCDLDTATLLQPLERALHALSWGVATLAAAATAARFR